MNGLPLRAYNKEYRKKTESLQPWHIRWSNYWLPALVSTGKITPSTEFKSKVSNMSDGFRKFFYNFRKKSTFRKSYIRRLLSIRMNTTLSLNYLRKKVKDGHIAAVFFTAFYFYFSNTGYSLTEERKLIEEHLKTSFSFKDFLEHVIWSFELGIDDRHWQRFHDLCKTCHNRYYYILHLKNIEEESSVFFRYVGYPEGTSFASKHRVKEVIGDDGVHKHKPKNNAYVYDMKLYKDIPKIIIDKLRRIYLVDLITFGFSIP